MKKVLTISILLMASISLKAQTIRSTNGLAWSFYNQPDTIIVNKNGVARRAVIKQKPDTIFVDTLRNFTPVFRYDNHGNVYIINPQNKKTTKVN